MFLQNHDALPGIAAIISERRRMIEQGETGPLYGAETQLGFGNYARAGALIAEILDDE